jgi:hypothetical protein
MDAFATMSLGTPPLPTIDDYAPLVGNETIERITKKAEKLRDLHVVNINSRWRCRASIVVDLAN